jgi:hypothetical protein
VNPEFQRNLWLEAGPRRLAWAGVALAAIYLGALLIGGREPWIALGGVGAAVFVVCGLVWGPRLAGRAVADEVAERTWDFQRLSALEPWSMAWGKLFGSTALAWAAGATGLALACLAALANGAPAGEPLRWIVAGVGAAVLLQAGALALALVGVRRARADGRTARFRFNAVGVIGFLLALGALRRVLPTRGVSPFSPFQWLFGGADTIRWWGFEAPTGWFAALSLAVFAAWALVAAWRLMRLELQLENGPWAWPAFVLFTGLYAAGFGDIEPSLRFAAAGAVFAACAYAAAFAEPADRVRLRGFAASLAPLDLARAMTTTPAVIAPVKLAAFAVIGMALTGAGAEGSRTPSALLALAAFAFLVRDVGVIAYFRFGPRQGRGDFGAVLGLFLLYLVGGIVGRTAGGAAGVALFTPSPEFAFVSAVAGAVEALVVWVLAWGRIRQPERAAT